MERKAGLRRQRKLSGALLSLSRSVQELTEENQSLKEDLDRVLSSSPTVARTKGTARASRALPPTARPARAGTCHRGGQLMCRDVTSTCCARLWPGGWRRQ